MSNWVKACAAEDIDEEDVMRFDHDGRTFAIYRSPEDEFFATETYHIPFPVDLIRRVTFGPSMPRQLAEMLKDILHGYPGCEGIPCALSRLDNNESWRKAVLTGFGRTN